MSESEETQRGSLLSSTIGTSCRSPSNAFALKGGGERRVEIPLRVTEGRKDKGDLKRRLTAELLLLVESGGVAGKVVRSWRLGGLVGVIGASRLCDEDARVCVVDSESGGVGKGTGPGRAIVELCCGSRVSRLGVGNEN